MICEVIKVNNIVYPKVREFKYGKYKMLDLNLVWEGSFFRILDSDDTYRKYKDNTPVMWDIKRVSRKMESLAKYWLIMQALAFHFPESEIDGKPYTLTADDYHRIMKHRFLPTMNIKTAFGEVNKESIAFDKMNDESEFKNYLSKVVNYIFELGYDPDELIRTM